MIPEAQFTVLQATAVDRLLLTVLQGLVVVGFLGVSALAVHLLVGPFRAENGTLRVRDARIALVGGGVLFLVGFTGLVTAEGTPAESLAGVALGFAVVTYLLSTTRPELFDRVDEDTVPTPTEDPMN